MSFNVNPSEWKPPVSNVKAQSMDNEGRSKGGGGYSKVSAFEKEDNENQHYNTEFSFLLTQDDDFDFIVKEDNWLTRFIDFIFNILKKLFSFIS